jgi:hypothetical protein
MLVRLCRSAVGLVEAAFKGAPVSPSAGFIALVAMPFTFRVGVMTVSDWVFKLYCT